MVGRRFSAARGLETPLLTYVFQAGLGIQHRPHRFWNACQCSTVDAHPRIPTQLPARMVDAPPALRRIRDLITDSGREC
jgi:hypothetical protein